MTASRFGEICCAGEGRDKNLLCKSLLENTPLSTPAIVHGKTWEKCAIQQFEKKEKMSVQQCGFFVSKEFPFLGASPDGLIGDQGLLEVKCPYTGRDGKIEPGKNFLFLQKEGNCVVLKKNHKYYYQVIGQLAITGRKFCYFAVYTHADFFVQKVPYDADFFEQKILRHSLPRLHCLSPIK